MKGNKIKIRIYIYIYICIYIHMDIVFMDICTYDVCAHLSIYTYIDIYMRILIWCTFWHVYPPTSSRAGAC